MLVLSRKEKQAIKIGDAITIVVVECANNWVKLAIDAPLHIKIVRTELLEKPDAEPGE